MAKLVRFVVTKPKKRENPSTNRFREELRSMNCRLESPTATMIPNMAQKMPPMIGSGMLTKNAPNLENRLNTIMNMAPT